MKEVRRRKYVDSRIFQVLEIVRAAPNKFASISGCGKIVEERSAPYRIRTREFILVSLEQSTIHSDFTTSFPNLVNKVPVTSSTIVQR